MKELDHLEIPIEVEGGNVITLYIDPQNKNKAKLFEVESSETGEYRHQLMEGCTYQYEFVSLDGTYYQFEKEDEIVTFHRASARHPNMGTITTGIYVGQLDLWVENRKTGNRCGKVNLEIRSTKSDYESDYRHMLDEIAEYYTDLVLQQGSPVTQQLKIDPDSSSETLYQKFSFVRSIVDSEAFSEAVHKIISNPIRKWTDANIEKNIVGVRRLSRKNIRQIASDRDRLPLQGSMRSNMPYGLDSVPRTIEVEYKRDTIDNQENQFVKFVLRTFSNFCAELKSFKNASDRLKAETDLTIEQLSSHLENQFFRQISMPTLMNMNSPVLQRKEGYREVFQAWLLFDMAAKLNWDGGEDVYKAGKKNVATLYEYWLFFKLLELISEFFNIEPVTKEGLVSKDNNRINLNLKQGKMRMVSGQQRTFSRVLNVAFYYNRTFSKISDEKDPIHKAGSWTMPMRPDYTLSLWPGEITQEEAEREELIVHIHFDAKYRLDKVLLDNNDFDVGEEKRQQELGVYKRADLLKMHAYKDAIRRTSGAYVLYPGTENKEIHGFHEIVPGLGAFSIRPGHWQQDSFYLKQFLAEVKANLMDRTSQRERMSYHQFDIHQKPNESMLMENVPEPVGDNRNFLPSEASVIVAFYKDQQHLNWILENHLYNMRAGFDKGSISLENDIINARYILLYNDKDATRLIRRRKEGPKVYTRSQLINMGYPQYMKSASNEVDTEREKKEANRIYLLLKLYKDNSCEKELQQYTWDIKDLVGLNRIGRSFAISLVDLLKKAKTK